MHKRTEIGPDHENPEWTDEKFARSVKFEALPAQLQKVLSPVKRGPQKDPKKVPVSIRLSKHVVDELRATGTGWQGRVDDMLQEWIKARGHKAKQA